MIAEIRKTIVLEGGYIYDTNDAGGETKFGISKRSYPNVDIKNLTLEEAIAIYKKDYWDKLQCDCYTNIQYRWKLFDIAVNQGVGTAMSFKMLLKKPDTLQGTYELVELQMKRYINIVVGKPSQIKYVRGWTNRAFDIGESLCG